MPRRVSDPNDVASALVPRRMLRELGWSERDIAAACAEGRLTAVRRGWYVESGIWADLWPEGRHLLHVLAVTRDGGGFAVLSHASAAVWWNLPLYRLAPTRVHVTTAPSQRIASGADVFRHVAPLPGADVVVRHGVACTSLSRTVFDVTRSLGMEAALVAADAAERSQGAIGRDWDVEAVTAWRAELAARFDGAAGARGIRQARWVADFSDGQAQLPGESVSRLQLHRLGFARPSLQVPVPGPNGSEYRVDFGLDDVDAFGEFDGKDKYVDESLRSGRSIEAVLLAEKQREDWIRGTTQRAVVRWEDQHITSPARLAARLHAFHIHPPR